MTAKKKNNTNIKRLVVTAVLIGLGTALSLIRFQMPLGGEITLLSLVPIALISIEYGVPWGLFGAFVYSLIQMGMQLSLIFTWGLSPTAVVGTIVLDYLLAYTAVGLSGLFRKKGIPGICAGIAIALIVRLIFHVISGTIIFAIWMPEGWANPMIYSICYNGIFILPEMLLTMLGSVILFKTPSFNRLVSGNIK